MKKLGIGIISWNRPQYLKQLIRSLVANNLDDTEFHLFQDGAICKFTGRRVAKDESIIESVAMFTNSSLPHRQVHERADNASIAINQYEAMHYLSEKYDHFIFLENDVVVSPNFIHLMREVLKQFENDERVASISPSFKLYCKEEDIKGNIDKLAFWEGHFWAEACWGKKWKKVEEKYIGYYNIVKNAPYKRRSSTLILKLFNDSNLPNRHGISSQDAGKDWAIKMAGMKRARFVVNRATGIGDYGVHCTPEVLKRHGEGHNTIYSPKEELDITEFKIVGSS